MFKLFIILFLFPLFGEDVVLFSLENYKVYSSDFYQQVPYNEWVELDSLKKEKAVDSFLERELSYYDALSFGVDVFPENNIKLLNRYNHLLVNNTYENLVAFPLIDSLSLSLSKKHLSEEVLAYHLLIGYSGCSLPPSFSRSQKEALNYISNIKLKIENSFTSSDSSAVVSSFSSFASELSEDPSVKDNGGHIGWISWGRVMSSFQQNAFNLPLFTVSDPVLTAYGYHLILIVNKRNSQYAYYNPSLLKDLSKKICLQSIPIDSLRAASTFFDSSLVSSDQLLFNSNKIDGLFNFLKEKELAGARGNKGAYLEWFKEITEKDVYFVYRGRGFGLGWFLYHLKKTPSTRVKTIASTGDIKALFRSFLLQEEVILLGKQKKITASPFFIGEFLNHKKNILKNNYLSFLIKSLPGVDSSLVKKTYNRGVYKGDYIAPKRVAYTEINTSSEDEVNALYGLFLSFGSFDSLLVDSFLERELSSYDALSLSFSVKQNTAVFTKQDPVVLEAFSLPLGGVSAPIKTKEGSFSLVQIEKVLDEIPWTIDRVYAQIERKIKKEQQDSIKQNLLSSLKLKYNIKGFSLP